MRLHEISKPSLTMPEEQAVDLSDEIEDGLHVEYEELTSLLDTWVLHGDYGSLRAFISHERFPEYQDQVHGLIRSTLGSRLVIVRVPGLFGTGERKGFVSASYLPAFANIATRKNLPMLMAEISVDQVLALGSAVEGEVIVPTTVFN